MSLMADWNDHPQTSAIIKSPFADTSAVMDFSFGKKLKDGKSKKNENDGWKILMDWGPCSVTCGGGVMTMQR